MQDQPTQVTPTWIEQVQQEAIAFANAVAHNFNHGLEASMKVMPIDSKQNRAKQLDIFLEAFTGIYVGVVCQFTNSSGPMEEATVETIRDKFKAFRMQSIANPSGNPAEIQ